MASWNDVSFWLSVLPVGFVKVKIPELLAYEDETKLLVVPKAPKTSPSTKSVILSWIDEG